MGLYSNFSDLLRRLGSATLFTTDLSKPGVIKYDPEHLCLPLLLFALSGLSVLVSMLFFSLTICLPQLLYESLSH